MDTPLAHSAVKAATASATSLGLHVDDAAVINASNRFAVRLSPCDVLARVAPPTHQAAAALELEVASKLAELGGPVTGPDPRVEPRAYERDGFLVTFWTYHEPVPPADAEPAEYAEALERMHAGMRGIDLSAPHFTDRVAEARGIVEDPARSPELTDPDRQLLSDALRELSALILRRSRAEQVLHGEPHPGNVLRTANGLLFTDFETCCRGPVEFDIAHYARIGPGAESIDARWSGAVARHYPGADPTLVRACWMLMQALVASWRWDRDDKFPDGRQMGIEWLGYLRASVERYGLEPAF